MKAIPVQRPATAPSADLPTAVDNTAPEVRKAIPIARSQPVLSRNFQQSFLTMPDPEVRRALPVAHGSVNRERASITILGDQVIVRPSSSASLAETKRHQN